MKRFEYKVAHPDVYNNLNAINQYGKDGWELVSSIEWGPTVIHYMKREITIDLDPDDNCGYSEPSEPV